MTTVHLPPRRLVDSAPLSGSLLVALAAFGFSAKAVLVKLAYGHQVDAVTLLAMRMAFSLPFFLLMALWRRPAGGAGGISAADGWAVIGLGLLGYYLASWLDFWGLEFISAGLERLILFLYPTLVVLLSWLMLGRAIAGREVVALVLSYIGIALVVYRQITTGSADLILGAALVFGSAVAYALYLLGSHGVIARLGATRFTAYAMTAASGACLVQFALTRPLSALFVDAPVYALALAMAIFSTVLPSLLLSLGIQRIGASRAALVGSLGPVATIALAHVFLGEVLSREQSLGALLVIAGVLWAGRGKN
ncbi:DMT family transporter [Methylococcus sp. EFPC2]|uniref:DMT family transporter n=1 Tax=Methylococcus sp. EFPC2 TaxID=2812648 RepID=UPI00196744C2|nr:DMT family transporter [Methylococcus sp. EFPC2]QSA96595.1 DMT family transporter [Methylococcus sp. EFPC2]